MTDLAVAGKERAVSGARACRHLKSSPAAKVSTVSLIPVPLLLLADFCRNRATQLCTQLCTCPTGDAMPTRGSRLLEDALEHLVRLAREEEHERSLVAVAPARDGPLRHSHASRPGFGDSKQ
eukprot:6205438-Pleurochrysis_carterae.AAC.5